MNNEQLCWLDLEMTGLNPDTDLILEIAAAVTDFDGKILMKPVSAIVHYNESELPVMDPWVMKQHAQSGLFADVAAATERLGEVEKKFLTMLQPWCKTRTFLAGNTIYQDRAFLRRYMPELNNLFHYRLVDVSSVKELVKNWYPKNHQTFFEKNKDHRALQDVIDSMAELQHYRKNFFVNKP